MRIHTDKPGDVSAAIYAATREMPGVCATISEHGSRSHAGALALRLEGNGTRGAGYADGSYQAATWDEWGAVLAAAFAADRDMVAGSVKRPVYASRADFHWKTDDRFEAGTMPEDAHKRHSWEFVTVAGSAGNVYRVRECRKCSAVKRF